MSYWNKIRVAYSGVQREFAEFVGKYYAAIPNNASADATVTRALDTATIVNKLGNIESVVANKGRVSYELGVDSCPCLLIEDARTNLFDTPLVPDTQDITVVVGVVYTVSVVGAGSVILSNAASEEVNQLTSKTITASTTTLTCTIVGVLSGVSVVEGYVPLSVANGTANEDVIEKETSLLNDVKFLFVEALIQNENVEFNKFYAMGSICNSDESEGYVIGRINNTIVFVNEEGVGFEYMLSSPARFDKIKACGQIGTTNKFYVNGVEATDVALFFPESYSNWNGGVYSQFMGVELTDLEMQQLTIL